MPRAPIPLLGGIVRPRLAAKIRAILTCERCRNHTKLGADKGLTLLLRVRAGRAIGDKRFHLLRFRWRWLRLPSGSANTSGRTHWNHLSHGSGMPLFRHPLTEGGRMPHILATTPVPPKRSIVLFANSSMPNRLTEPNEESNRPAEKSWSARLVRELDAASINQAELARRCGVSAPTVTDWLNGKIKMISGNHLVNVCEVLRINPIWLITGRGNKLLLDQRKIQRRQKERRAAG